MIFPGVAWISTTATGQLPARDSSQQDRSISASKFMAVNLNNIVKCVNYLPVFLLNENKAEAHQSNTRTQKGTDCEPETVANSSFIRLARSKGDDVRTRAAPESRCLTYFSDTWSGSRTGFSTKDVECDRSSSPPPAEHGGAHVT